MENLNIEKPITLNKYKLIVESHNNIFDRIIRQWIAKKLVKIIAVTPTGRKRITETSNSTNQNSWLVVGISWDQIEPCIASEERC